MTEMVSKLGSIQGTVTTNGLTRVNRIGRDISFSEVLKARLENEVGITFSAHAVERLNERGITLNKDEVGRLAKAVSRAEEKRVSDSLILMDNMAFIVSIKNHTVVTAMTGDSIKDNIFTNIDSTVIV